MIEGSAELSAQIERARESVEWGKICVFTPTYNRAYCLGNLYESLCAQDCGGFSWLIVDDGSTDGTEDLVRGFQEASPFPIAYIKQPNGGKQRAHNTGTAACDAELFFCVDSDDTLVPDALSAIWDRWVEVRGRADMAGVIALQGPAADEPHHGSWMPEGVAETTMWDLYYEYGHKGDTAHIYRTDVLRAYPFEVAAGEKFIAETFVYHQIDQRYTLAVLDRVVTIQEYLPDGYSKNVRKVTRENPKGYRRLKRMYIGYAKRPRDVIESTILYMVGCMLDHDTAGGVREAPNKLLAVLAIPFAWLLCKMEFRERK